MQQCGCERLSVLGNSARNYNLSVLEIEAAARIENAFEEGINLVAQTHVDCEVWSYMKVIVEIPCLEVIVVALERLERTTSGIIRITEKKISKSIACVSSDEAKVTVRILADAESIPAVQPFHAELHLVPAGAIVD